MDKLPKCETKKICDKNLFIPNFPKTDLFESDNTSSMQLRAIANLTKIQELIHKINFVDVRGVDKFISMYTILKHFNQSTCSLCFSNKDACLKIILILRQKSNEIWELCHKDGSISLVDLSILEGYLLEKKVMMNSYDSFYIYDVIKHSDIIIEKFDKTIKIYERILKYKQQFVNYKHIFEGIFVAIIVVILSIGVKRELDSMKN